MEYYRVMVEGRGLYHPAIETVREAYRVKAEAELYYPAYRVTVESYYVPAPTLLATG